MYTSLKYPLVDFRRKEELRRGYLLHPQLNDFIKRES
jgi:hypothetical protein